MLYENRDPDAAHEISQRPTSSALLVFQTLSFGAMADARPSRPLPGFWRRRVQLTAPRHRRVEPTLKRT